jgi:hypothetical protein
MYGLDVMYRFVISKIWRVFSQNSQIHGSATRQPWDAERRGKGVRF